MSSQITIYGNVYCCSHPEPTRDVVPQKTSHTPSSAEHALIENAISRTPGSVAKISFRTNLSCDKIRRYLERAMDQGRVIKLQGTHICPYSNRPSCLYVLANSDKSHIHDFDLVVDDLEHTLSKDMVKELSDDVYFRLQHGYDRSQRNPLMRSLWKEVVDPALKKNWL